MRARSPPNGPWWKLGSLLSGMHSFMQSFRTKADDAFLYRSILRSDRPCLHTRKRGGSPRTSITPRTDVRALHSVGSVAGPKLKMSHEQQRRHTWAKQGLKKSTGLIRAGSGGCLTPSASLALGREGGSLFRYRHSRLAQDYRVYL